MSQKTHADEADKLFDWASGDRGAAKFLSDLSIAVQIADDFVDQDKGQESMTTDRMLRLMHTLLVDIPANPFYRMYEQQLRPIISNSLIIWNETNYWAASDDENQRVFAYVYREIGEQIIITVATITGGLEHASRVTHELHEHYHSEKTFEDWDRDRTARDPERVYPRHLAKTVKTNRPGGAVFK